MIGPSFLPPGHAHQQPQHSQPIPETYPLALSSKPSEYNCLRWHPSSAAAQRSSTAPAKYPLRAQVGLLIRRKCQHFPGAECLLMTQCIFAQRATVLSTNRRSRVTLAAQPGPHIRPQLTVMVHGKLRCGRTRAVSSVVRLAQLTVIGSHNVSTKTQAVLSS